jgi:hypothetical protein
LVKTVTSNIEWAPLFIRKDMVPTKSLNAISKAHLRCTGISMPIKKKVAGSRAGGKECGHNKIKDYYGR